MPRKKSAPSRRVEVPNRGPEEALEPPEEDYFVIVHDDEDLVEGSPTGTQQEDRPRPAKRRKTLKEHEGPEFQVSVALSLQDELLVFLEVRNALVGTSVEDATQAVACVGCDQRDGFDSPYVCIKITGDESDASPKSVVFRASSKAVAEHLCRLLQMGVLGLALSAMPLDIRAYSRRSPIMYSWCPDSLPRRCTDSGALPGSAGPSSSSREAGARMTVPLDTEGAAAGPTASASAQARPEPADTEGDADWRPAVYLPRVAGGAGTDPTALCSAHNDAGGLGDLGRGQRITLQLGIRYAVLDKLAAAYPDDMQRRAWQAQLLDVLAWLLPHIGVDGEEAVRQERISAADDATASGIARNPPPLSPSQSTAKIAAPALPASSNAPATQQQQQQQAFDAGWLYSAVKPSGGEPQWQGDPMELRPRLRPYQRRAVHWMLRREHLGRTAEANKLDGDAAATTSAGPGTAQGEAAGGGAGVSAPCGTAARSLHPLWRRLHLLPGGRAGAELYVNPYSGALASERFPPPAPVRGGILADEMGLGKTVELLALITANRLAPAPDAREQDPPHEQPEQRSGAARNRRDPGKQVPKARQAEHVDCPCGVRSEDPSDPLVEEYEGLWILCDSCNAWMHGACVGVKRTPRSAWVCTRCLRKRAMQTVSEPCGATLIVVPSAILQQWYDEIRRHIHPGALRVVVYGGQTQPGCGSSGLIVTGDQAGGGGGSGGRARGSGGKGRGGGSEDVAESMVVSAAQLAAADVVLTTYDVLKRDVSRQPDLQVQERNMRHTKRYEVVPTPLTRLRWWRVVLDEAQMVESSTAKATEMALKLDTVHRWCVTGTPISRGLEDVFGLMSFLGARPWNDRRWWNRCIQRPLEAGDPAGRRLLLRLLRPAQRNAAGTAAREQADPGQGLQGDAGGPANDVVDGWSEVAGNAGLMWRSSKRDVEAELGLPPQSNHLTHLRLNAVELHFYNTQHQDCAAKARAVLPPRVVAIMESGRLYDANPAAEAEPDAQPEENSESAAAAGDAAAHSDRGEGVNDGSVAATVAAAAVMAPADASRPHGSPVSAGDTHRDGCGCALTPAGAAATSERTPVPAQHAEAGDVPAELPPDPLREQLQELGRQRWLRWQQGGGCNGDGAAGTGSAGTSAGAEPGPSGSGGAAAGPSVASDDGCRPRDHNLSEEDIVIVEDEGGHHEDAQPAGQGEQAGDGDQDQAARADQGAGGRGGGPGRPALTSVRKALIAASSNLDRPLAPYEARKLLGPLLKLRQACCHPQVGAGGLRALAAGGGQNAHNHPHHSHHGAAPMTMQEILDVLVTRAKTEAEEAQRLLIASLNGLAALMIIQGDVVEAVATYRKALRVMEDNKAEIGTDKFQQLHTLHNLGQMLASPAAQAAALPRTLRDHNLAEDAEAIRGNYLTQRRGELISKEADYRELVQAATPFHGASGWYMAAIDLLMMTGHGSAATDYIKEKLLEGDTYRQKTEVNASSMVHRFSNLLGLKLLLNESLDGIEEKREVVMRTLEDLGRRTRQPQPSPDFVEQAGQCGRCRDGRLRSLICEHCRLDDRFIEWEVRLFALYSRALTAGAQVTAEEAARRAQAAMVRWAGRGGLDEERGAEEGLPGDVAGDEEFGARRGANVGAATTAWKQSEAEMVLRLLVSQLRHYFKKSGDDRVEELIREGKAHVDRLEAQRRLLVAARAVGLAQRMLLYAHDELGMAIMRMRLAREDEPIAPHEVNLKLHPAAVPVKNVELSTDRVVAEGDLRKTLGTLRYLRKLQAIQQQQQQRRQQQQQQQQQGAPILAQPDLIQKSDASAAVDGGSNGTVAAATPGPAAAITPVDVPELGPSSAGSSFVAGACCAGSAASSGSSSSVPAPPAVAAATTGPDAPGTSGSTGNAVGSAQNGEAACTAGPSSGGGAGPSSSGAGLGSGDNAGSAGPGAGGSGAVLEEELCPICHEAIDVGCAPSVIMPCGHQLHPACSDALVAKTVAPSTPYHQKRVTCPTCRTRVHIADIAYIDMGPSHGSAEAADASAAGEASGPWSGEAAVSVRGSFGTKIEAVLRRIKFILGQDAAAKVLVFSGWADLLELVAAALRDNAVPHVVARGKGGMTAALAAFKDHPGEVEEVDGVGEVPEEDEGGPTTGAAAGDHTTATAGDAAATPALPSLSPAPAHVAGATSPALWAQAGDPSMPDSGAEGSAPPAGSSGSGAVGGAIGRASPLASTLAVAGGFTGASAGGTNVPAAPGAASATQEAAAAGVHGAAGSAGESGALPMPPSKRARSGAPTPGSLLSPLGFPSKKSRPGLQAKPRVLLLQLKQGGAGLNLTEAQHVVLVEPQLDPAAEAQAVGRVHRIGQSRPTHVHRFVVAHSVEEQVFKLASARARGMDLAAAVPATRGHGGGHHGRGAAGTGDGADHLTVRDVAVLLDTRWGGNVGGAAGEARARAGSDNGMGTRAGAGAGAKVDADGGAGAA